jgi:UDP-N-acetylglucosamine 2-epimerase (non-hydrolysing)
VTAGKGQGRLRVVTILGTRPEVIKLSRVIATLDGCTDHVLVHSGQNSDYELNAVFFEQLGIRAPDHHLGVQGRTPAEAIADVIRKSDEVLERVQPDALLVYGDTNTCLCVLPAKRRRIPVFHMEAGNRCFDQRVPEELNRKVVDHLSDINMPLTEHARRYLLAEGLRPETVIRIGSPMREVLEHHRAQIERSGVLASLGLTDRGFFLVSAHREENVDRPEYLRKLLDSLAALRREFGIPIVVSTHPRTRKRLEALSAGAPLQPEGVSFLKPFGFLDYVKLEMSARCVLSDSGTITEEAAILGFPAVTIREAHERPEGMDAGVLVMSGLTPERVLDAVRLVTMEPRRPCDEVPDYADRNVSGKVARIVLSYVEYVNRTVWGKGIDR